MSSSEPLSDFPTGSEHGMPQGHFSGRAAFLQLLQLALHEAAQRGWRELVLCDASFLDWPLGERATVDALQAWAAPGRRLLLLAQRFDVFERHHARFVQWRRLQSQLIDARVCHGAGYPDVPSGFWSPEWFMHRKDPVLTRGSCGHEPVRRAALRERIDECLGHAKPGFAASTLGL